MARTRFEKKQNSFGKKLGKIIFGFLLPYILINGTIFFLFIQTPKIMIIDTDAKDYEESKIKFTVESILPIVDIRTYFQEEEIPYTRFGAYYILDANNNGTYEITVKSLNQAISNSYVNIEAMDSEPPKINTNDAIITGSILSLTVSDEQSGINYDNVYGLDEDQKTIEPIYIDKSSGTIQFDFTDRKKLTIHVEDNYGNSTETVFNAG